MLEDVWVRAPTGMAAAPPTHLAAPFTRPGACYVRSRGKAARSAEASRPLCQIRRLGSSQDLIKEQGQCE